LRATAELHFPELRAVHIDAMRLTYSAFRKFYASAYDRLVKHHPAIWATLYRMTDRRVIGSPPDLLRRAMGRLNIRPLLAAVAEAGADTVVCTHFLPAELLADAGGGVLGRRVWMQVTDFGIHQYWVQPGMTGYCVASDHTARALAARGVDPGRIHVTGIPIMPAFAQRLSREECAREIGADPARPTALVVAGAAGISQLKEPVRRLAEAAPELQIIAVAGRNRRLRAALQQLARRHPGRIFPTGYTTTIERLMAASDLAITKPGGLIISECLALGLPLVLISPIPGQEEHNADFLSESGAAIRADDPGSLPAQVRALLDDRARLEAMRERAVALGRPHAASDVLRVVMQD